MKDWERLFGNLKIHFMYTVILLVLISCAVGGIALYRQDIAIEGLSNAALLLSIVLAVMAILITIWDVSGQKQSVFDVKKQVELLEGLVEDDKLNRNELTKIIVSLFSLHEKLQIELKENKRTTQELYSLLTELKAKEGDDEIAEKIEELLKRNASEKLTEKDFIPQDQRKNYIKNVVVKIIQQAEFSTEYEIYKELLNRNLEVTQQELRNITDELVDGDYFIFMADNDGVRTFHTF